MVNTYEIWQIVADFCSILIFGVFIASLVTMLRRNQQNLDIYLKSTITFIGLSLLIKLWSGIVILIN